MLANAGPSEAGAAQRAAAAAAAGGMGFGDTVKTSPSGAAAPSTARQKLGGET